MNIKQGDKVKVDGSESVVTSFWGQGKHTAYALEDGRTVLNITEDELIERAKSNNSFGKKIKNVNISAISMVELDEDDLKD